MTPSTIFGTQLPLGRTLFIAWITAALIHVFPAVNFTIPDISPIEFGLRAGLFFGYYIVFFVVNYGIVYLIWFLIHKLLGEKRSGTYGNFRGDRVFKSFHPKFWLDTYIHRIAEVVAMFTAFITFTNLLFQILAPIGLLITLMLYMMGVFEVTEKK